MPIYDKPMIYYPLSILMMSGIRDILIITKPSDEKIFYELLGNGNQFGINLSYKTQKSPDGIAQAFIIAEKFLLDHKCALILGDNIFYGEKFKDLLNKAYKKEKGATVFSYKVNNPEDYGVIEHKKGKILSIEEKPQNPKSEQIITGLYFYDEDVVEYAKSLKPSNRGELEITDINNIYLKKNLLSFEYMDENYLWIDTGTHDLLLNAGNIISDLEKQKNQKIYSPEEIGYRQKWLSANELNIISDKFKNTNYGKYLKKILEEN
jgi:glucose-1-phosphate thymidylyltransferase